MQQKMDGCVKGFLYLADLVVGCLGGMLILLAMGQYPNNFGWDSVVYLGVGAILMLSSLGAGIVLALIPSDF